MATQAKIELLIEGAQGANTLGELKTSAEGLTVALEEAEIGSKEYKKLNQQLVQTNKQVKNLELGFESLDQEQIAGELGSVAGAVGDVTSAMILLGGENENIAEMGARIEKAIGVSMAFKGAIEGASSAFKLFNNVIRANPIGAIITLIVLLIIGIIALIKNWDKLGKLFTSTGKKLKSLTDRLGKYKNALLLLLGPIGLLIIAWNKIIELQEKFKSQSEKNADRELRLQKARSRAANKRHQQRLREIEAEREAENKAHESRQTQFDLDVDRMEANGGNSFTLRKQKIEDLIAEEEAVLESNAQKLASWEKYYEELAAFSGKSREDFIAQLKGQGVDLIAMQEKATEFQKEQEQRIFAARTELIGLERAELERVSSEREQRNSEELAAEQELLDKIALEREQARKDADDLFKRQIAARDKLLQLQEDRDATALEKKLNKLRRAHEKEIAFLDETIPIENELKLELERKFQEEMLLIQEENLQKEMDLRNAAQEQRQAAKLEEAEKTIALAEQVTGIADDLNTLVSSREIKRIKEKQKRGESLTKSEIRRLKRQEAIGKIFAIAQIATDTARGIAAAVAAGAGIPFPGNIPAILSGVAAVLGGAVQAQAVLGESVNIPSGPTEADIESGNLPEQQAQNVPVINQAGFGSTLLNQPTKVFVVESDITDTQNEVQAIVEQATFG